MTTPTNRALLAELMDSIGERAAAGDFGFREGRYGEAILAAIEAAGCIVFQREPNAAVIEAMEEMHMPFGEMVAAWDGACMASPFNSDAQRDGSTG